MRRLLTGTANRPQPALPCECERCRTFGRLAPSYDDEIDADEAAQGIGKMRRKLGSRACGAVLEIAGGTGRNLKYYTSAVTELLLSDNSLPMLQVAARKVAKGRVAAVVGVGGASGPPSKVTLAVLDACALALPSAEYDTVVDSFGLCSFEQPADALREMRRCVKPGGQVLLLEHGVSDLAPVAWWQQHRLNRHVVGWGCYWNRDILGLVEASGLRVTSVERRQLGTLLLISCVNDQ